MIKRIKKRKIIHHTNKTILIGLVVGIVMLFFISQELASTPKKIQEENSVYTVEASTMESCDNLCKETYGCVAVEWHNPQCQLIRSDALPMTGR